MSVQSKHSHLFERYLSLLGVDSKPPCYDALSEIVTAHLMRIPFENLSKLYNRKHVAVGGLPDLELYLDGIDRYNFGGTCYANNYFLHLLLAHLGYDVRLCGADMDNPDVHIVNMVTVAGREYLVDTGYGAPFLQPFRRDLPHDQIVESGNERYLLKPQDKEGCSQVEHWRDGALIHGYRAKPIPRKIEYFSEVIADSYSDAAMFMNRLALIRFYLNRSVAIRNLHLIQTEGLSTRIRKIKNRSELLGIVEKHFAIPAQIVAQAIAGLGDSLEA